MYKLYIRNNNIYSNTMIDTRILFLLNLHILNNIIRVSYSIKLIYIYI